VELHSLAVDLVFPGIRYHWRNQFPTGFIGSVTADFIATKSLFPFSTKKMLLWTTANLISSTLKTDIPGNCDFAVLNENFPW
jgi:hypothetical protein